MNDMADTAAGASFRALGTDARVLVADPAHLDAAVAAVAAEVEDVDRTCSRFRGDSELVGLELTAGKVVPVSPLLAEALGIALRAAELTDGLVDPTVGEAVRILGYDTDFASVAIDGPPVVHARRVPGWEAIELDRARGTVRVPGGVRLDLGATAKAWCADRAAERAAAAVPCGLVVNFGGDVRIAGPAVPGGWPVLLADWQGAPLGGEGEVIELDAGGLATSGTSVRRWQRGDVEMHHIVDPRSASPAGPVWRTVSVAAGTCVDANIASIASVILGHAAPAWLEERGLPARLVEGDGSIVRVNGWPAPRAAEALR